jgi:hypothetical protein
MFLKNAGDGMGSPKKKIPTNPRMQLMVKATKKARPMSSPKPAPKPMFKATKKANAKKSSSVIPGGISRLK